MEAIGLLFVACALAGIAIPMPEDVALIAAGTTIEDPWMFLGFSVAGALGLLCRDGLFFTLGHFAGEGLLKWPMVRRLFGESRIERGRALVEERGGRAVLFARFLIGFRSTGFLVSGALGVRFRDFLLWDTLGVVISVPVVLALGIVLGEPITAAVLWILDHRLLFLGLLALGALGWLLRHRMRKPSDPTGTASST